jgi:alpha-tubulin suppressor-like RCC1 family protein
MSDTHACALLADATVACWGVGFDGQLGFPAAPSGDVDMRGELSVIASKPERVVGVAGAKGVFVGSRVTCIRTSSGEVTCFGLVGLGDSGADLRVPRTTFPDLAGAKDLFLGSGTHCAVLAEGTSCWGASATGPLSAPNQGGVGWSKLVRASTIDAPRALAITFGRACAVGQDGLVTCFGYDGRDRSAPRVVAGLTNVVAIGVGASHVCALDQAGAVSCWGGTASGQVGRIEGPRISPLFGEVHTIPLP